MKKFFGKIVVATAFLAHLVWAAVPAPVAKEAADLAMDTLNADDMVASYLTHKVKGASAYEEVAAIAGLPVNRFTEVLVDLVGATGQKKTSAGTAEAFDASDNGSFDDADLGNTAKLVLPDNNRYHVDQNLDHGTFKDVMFSKAASAVAKALEPVDSASFAAKYTPAAKYTKNNGGASPGVNSKTTNALPFYVNWQMDGKISEIQHVNGKGSFVADPRMLTLDPKKVGKHIFEFSVLGKDHMKAFETNVIAAAQDNTNWGSVVETLSADVTTMGNRFKTMEERFMTLLPHLNVEQADGKVNPMFKRAASKAPLLRAVNDDASNEEEKFFVLVKNIDDDAGKLASAANHLATVQTNYADNGEALVFMQQTLVPGGDLTGYPVEGTPSFTDLDTARTRSQTTAAKAHFCSADTMYTDALTKEAGRPILKFGATLEPAVKGYLENIYGDFLAKYSALLKKSEEETIGLVVAVAKASVSSPNGWTAVFDQFIKPYIEAPVTEEDLKAKADKILISEEHVVFLVHTNNNDVDVTSGKAFESYYGALGVAEVVKPPELSWAGQQKWKGILADNSLVVLPAKFNGKTIAELKGSHQKKCTDLGDTAWYKFGAITKADCGAQESWVDIDANAKPGDTVNYLSTSDVKEACQKAACKVAKSCAEVVTAQGEDAKNAACESHAAGFKWDNNHAQCSSTKPTLAEIQNVAGNPIPGSCMTECCKAAGGGGGNLINLGTFAELKAAAKNAIALATFPGTWFKPDVDLTATETKTLNTNLPVQLELINGEKVEVTLKYTADGAANAEFVATAEPKFTTSEQTITGKKLSALNVGGTPLTVESFATDDTNKAKPEALEQDVKYTLTLGSEGSVVILVPCTKSGTNAKVSMKLKPAMDKFEIDEAAVTVKEKCGADTSGNTGLIDKFGMVKDLATDAKKQLETNIAPVSFFEEKLMTSDAQEKKAGTFFKVKAALKKDMGDVEFKLKYSENGGAAKVTAVEKVAAEGVKFGKADGKVSALEKNGGGGKLDNAFVKTETTAEGNEPKDEGITAALNTVLSTLDFIPETSTMKAEVKVPCTKGEASIKIQVALVSEAFHFTHTGFNKCAAISQTPKGGDQEKCSEKFKDDLEKEGAENFCKDKAKAKPTSEACIQLRDKKDVVQAQCEQHCCGEASAGTPNAGAPNADDAESCCSSFAEENEVTTTEEESHSFLENEEISTSGAPEVYV